ncbi:uncharacterized protein UMAG_05167 [Mycosarcoma maydis]|uniref:Uncharacterized protein n=1 Tax=Mycosarcoma maydis TaxID=5270 RepID=A0A0D1E1W5_MYCMD|nr:uncharacterized protein UMAG_05167 [Ustilago maydis 521]KIS70094.1 hypothetical protein UMAG_05167 [Ustilago maydis 521]|eukprot:XP_011388221.1 hypothetical protein UMAG_05167 [Ustilago maydis 521]
MYCLRWWIPLFLLPFPKASPLFLVLFLFSFALHSQPCMYCALILTGLVTTSPNWYGPNSTIVALTQTNSSASPSLFNTSVPRPSYGWLDFGFSGGNGFFSPLSRPCDGTDSAQDAVDTAAASQVNKNFYRLSIPWCESQLQIPKRFFVGVGKHQGIGVWIDLGSGLKDAEPSVEPTRTPTRPPVAGVEKHTEL